MLVSPLMVRSTVILLNPHLPFNTVALINQGTRDVANFWDHHCRQESDHYWSEKFATRNIPLDTLRLHLRPHSRHHRDALGLQRLANR